MILSEIKDWQDLRVGDTVIQKNDNVIYQVEAIDLKYTDHHVCIRGNWVRDAELINYQKIEVNKKEPLLLEDLIHERNSRPVSEYIEKLEEKIDRLTKENIKLKDEESLKKSEESSNINNETDVLETLFIEKYPEYEVYGKPLSEYFDIFKNGYELSELKIAELKDEVDRLTKENIDLKDEVESWKKVANSKVNWDEINEYSDLLSKLAGLR